MRTSDPESQTRDLAAAYRHLAQDLERSGALSRDQIDAMRRFGENVDRFARHRDLMLLRYRLLFEEAPDPYLVTGPEGTIVEANAAAHDLLHAGTPLVGTRFVDYIAAPHRERFERWLGHLRDGTPAARCDTALDVAGEALTIPVEISLADDLEGIGHRWLLRDQRQRVAAERRLRKVAESEHMAAAELRTESRAKTDFLVSLSHDLRAPVGALVHQAELLTTSGVPETVRQRSQEALQANAALLAEMLDALVEMERFALGELVLDLIPTPLPDIVQDLADVGDAGQAPIHISLPADDIMVSVDAAAMRRALRAVVSSVRQGSDGSALTIGATPANGEVVITISPTTGDGQPGPVELFDSGVDMRRARTLIDLHGGQLMTATGDEARITISLPRAEGGGSHA